MREIKLPEISPVRYTARVYESPDSSVAMLVLEFRGSLPNGSKGNVSTGFMTMITRLFLVLQGATCVLFDLRNLEYGFGDSLMGPQTVVNVEHDQLPVAYLVSDKCRKGVESLLEFANRSHETPLFEDLDSALAWARSV